MNFVFYLHDEKSTSSLEERLLWLKSRYSLISSQDVESYYYNNKKWKDVCHITIDDGWLSTYQIIFPLLKKHNIPVTIFVSPETCKNGLNFWYYDIRKFHQEDFKSFLIDKKYFSEGIEKFPLELLLKEMKIDDVYSSIHEFSIKNNIDLSERGFINAKELLEMSNSGLVEIGAHTMCHPILAAESDERSEREIKTSISSLCELLNKPITTFAYPNGLWKDDFGRREMQYVSEMGVKLAYSVQPGVMDSKRSPFAIPRIGSLSRLKLGYLGLFLPSLQNQSSIRTQIKKYIK